MANVAGYAIKKRLARGSMAEVFVASRLGAAGFERDVLMKRLLPHLAKDPGVVDLFLHEARVLARVAHPHVATVLDLGERDGDYFIVLELVDGPDLRAVVDAAAKRGMPIQPADAIYLTTCLLDALRYVHSCVDDERKPLQLVHRDITLSNVML